MSSANMQPTIEGSDELFLSLLYKGGELLSAGNLEEARDHLERAYQLRPDNSKCQNLLGLAYFKLQLYEQAAEVYEVLVADNPGDPTLRVNLGLVFLKSGQLPRAQKEFESAVDLSPTHQKAHNYLGLTLAQVGAYARARDHFVKAGSDALAEKMARALASPHPARTESREPSVSAASAVEVQHAEMAIDEGEAPAQPVSAAEEFVRTDPPRSVEALGPPLGGNWGEMFEMDKVPPAEEPQSPVEVTYFPRKAAPLIPSEPFIPSGVEGPPSPPLIPSGVEGPPSPPLIPSGVEGPPSAPLIPSGVEGGPPSEPSIPNPPFIPSEVEGGPPSEPSIPSPPLIPSEVEGPQTDEVSFIEAMPEEIVPSPETSPTPPPELSVSQMRASTPSGGTVGASLAELATSAPLPIEGYVASFQPGEETCALAVSGELYARLEGWVATSGAVATEPVRKRYRGAPTDKSFGTGARQMYWLNGQGVMFLETGGRAFQVMELGQESVFFREEAVFGFESGVAFENGRLTAEGGETLDLVHLAGPGKTLIQLSGVLRSLEVRADRPVTLPAERLLGWLGSVTPRLLPGGELAVELSGEGFALFAVPSPSSR